MNYKFYNFLAKYTPSFLKKMYHSIKCAVQKSSIKKKMNQRLINKFSYFFYHSKALTTTKWLGVNLLKFPTDLWIYQEILFDKKPDVIVECGTWDGGSAFFLASLCDLMGKGEIISIDINFKESFPKHERVTYVTGSSTSENIVSQVKKLIGSADKKVMIILDSDHSKGHVLKELEIYSELATVGQYIIVEDSIVNGHPAFPDHGPGPMEALLAFLDKDDRFASDLSREKFFVTQNPKGYLLKTKQ